jgi:phosphoglycolate phosphatase-like HAD superfamily hydrolase
MNKLVLFDVDGILVKNVYSKPQPSASGVLIKKHLGIDIGPFPGSLSGMTDRGVVVERLRSAGIKCPEEHPKLGVMVKDFENVTREIIKEHGVERIEGVEDFIKELLKQKITIGLLTGNTPGRAELKLSVVGLWKYFKIGAFGHNTTIRSELVGVALKDALEKTGIDFGKKNVFIVGDTGLDIKCARDGGVKSLAVATGTSSFAELKKNKPDFVFEDFKDIKSILSVING